MDCRLVRHSVLAVGLAVLAVACGKSPTSPSGTGGGSGSTATVTSVTISGNLAPAEGSSSQLTATAGMSNGQTQNVSSQATWRSSDTSVATVSATGLVTALKTGTADITAAYQAQTGRGTLQVAAARFSVSVSLQSITALDTCDNVTQGLTNGEFATRVLAIRPGGLQSTLDQTTAYPGDPNNLRVYNLSRGESMNLNVNRSYTLNGAAGQFVRIQFNATEWDQQVVIIPPSTRWIHDSDMDNRSTSRTHTYSNGTFTGLGPNALTLGNSSCGLRLNYTVSATRQ